MNKHLMVLTFALTLQVACADQHHAGVDGERSAISEGEDDGVVCADLVYETNGVCEAAPGCDHNDPVDCSIHVGLPGENEGDEEDGVVCADIAFGENGECEAPPGCEFNDPDCLVVTDPPGEEDGDEECPVEIGDPDDGIVCAQALYPNNGECEAAPGCEYNDPEDCLVGVEPVEPPSEDDGGDGVVCAAVLYPSNGECEAAPGCEHNDPEDCAVTIDDLE